MKLFKKLLAVATACVLALSILAACSSINVETPNVYVIKQYQQYQQQAIEKVGRALPYTSKYDSYTKRLGDLFFSKEVACSPYYDETDAYKNIVTELKEKEGIEVCVDVICTAPNTFTNPMPNGSTNNSWDFSSIIAADRYVDGTMISLVPIGTTGTAGEYGGYTMVCVYKPVS